ncbi:MAG: hypothetical protein FWH18_06805 [Marinilabiliaceae bacterium]|nr:hypothetical protein [Marinilabiliaceae bacterium]
MIESLELIKYDANVRRAMQEEYWAEVDEAMWESQVEELTLQNKNLYNQNATLTSEVVNLSSENMTLSRQIFELQQRLKQAGIELPST